MSVCVSVNEDQGEGVRMGRFSDPMAREIGLRIRVLREERGLNQDAVAEAIGIERASLSNIERGRHHPALRTTVALAEYFGVSLKFLILGAVATADGGEFKGKVTLLWEWLSEAQRHQFIVQMAAVVLENTLTEVTLNKNATDQKIENKLLELEWSDGRGAH